MIEGEKFLKFFILQCKDGCHLLIGVTESHDGSWDQLCSTIRKKEMYFFIKRIDDLTVSCNCTIKIMSWSYIRRYIKTILKIRD